MSKSLNHRRDDRTVRQFKKDIKSSTKKERFLVELFREEMKFLGHTIRISNYGTDNTGKLVKYSSCKPDFKITVDGKTELYDIKNSPVSHKWTFKVYNLEQYVLQDANILVFWGTGYINKNTKQINRASTRWGIITPKKIKKMLRDYEPYNEPMFGNKSCIQIPNVDFKKFCKVNYVS